MFKVMKILVPTDLSEASTVAEQHAGELASALGAELVLLHVLDETPMMLVDGAGYLPADAFSDYEARAREQLALSAERLSGAKVKVSLLLMRGQTDGTILKAAKQERADLIVMGTHGRRGFRHFMLGSVAERVVRTSPVPVMTVGNRAQLEVETQRASDS